MGVDVAWDVAGSGDVSDGGVAAGQRTDGRGREETDLPGRRRVMVYNGTGTAIDPYQAVAWDVGTAGRITGKWVKIAPATDNGPYAGNATSVGIPALDWGEIEVGEGVGYAYVTDATAAETQLHMGGAQAGELEAWAAGDIALGYTLEAEGATIEDVALCYFY